MKVYELSPYNNERLVASIKMDESRSWVNELHVTESNRTFRNQPKIYSLEASHARHVIHHKLDGEHVFFGETWGLSRKPPYLRRALNPWRNEAVQRNYASTLISPEDDDVVIFSDIDEIIDHRKKDEVLDQVRKHGIVTVGLYLTLYYFDLFSQSWPGPPDYSYRVFLMTGQYFRRMQASSDMLRKLGEAGHLTSSVFRLPGFQGFHHSWLGNQDLIMNKLLSYSHDISDHAPGVFHEDGTPDQENIRRLLKTGASIFGPKHELRVRNDVPLLASVEAMRTQEFSHLFSS